MSQLDFLQRRPYFRTIFYLALLITSLLLILNSFALRFDVLQLQLFNTTVKLVEVNETEGCVFPELNPFDPTILEYISHPTKVACKKIQPYLTFIDPDGFLQFNESEYEYYTNEKNYSNVKCVYKTFDRSMGMDDNDWSYATEQKLTQPVKLTRDMVEVGCTAHDSKGKKDNKFYYNLHAHPAKRDPRIFQKPTDDQLSVLFIGIDSVALSVLKRNMPLTYDYVTNKMGMFMFKRFNKIGDNTLPNMMAALTGKRVVQEQDDMKSEFPNFDKVEYFDSFPLIWKFFAAKGYATVFNEDKPEWGLFHYLAEGFARKPMEFYYHILWEAIRKAKKKNDYEKYCFANTPRGDVLLDINRRHLMSMKDTLQFIYSFFVEYSHDLGNEIERADKIFAEFWREMYEDQYLNKTVVIFFSDHGHRFSSIRKTLVGLLEERNPFLGIWFPSWFYDLHPGVKRNLMINTERLSSTFDLHETLKDILEANYDGAQRPRNKRGFSQLYEIPTSRTCPQAGIPQHYCLCIREEPLNVTQPVVLESAKILVNYLNKLLSSYKQCQRILYNSTIRAESVDYDDRVKNGLTHRELKKFNSRARNKTEEEDALAKIRIAIKTQPDDAIFESTLVKNVTTDVWFVTGEVQRLSSYGNSSYCINKATLRKYCSCSKKT